MVAVARLSHEWMLAVRPVHGSAVNDHASDRSAVATDPFSRTVSDDVAAMLERLAHVTAAAEGVVTNERDTVFVSHLGDPFEVWHVEARVAECLDVQGLSIAVDQPPKRLRFVRGIVWCFDELALDA